MTSFISRRRSNWEVFRIPLLVAALSTWGLVSALVGDGIYDVISWITLGIPVLIIIWATTRSQKR